MAMLQLPDGRIYDPLTDRILTPQPTEPDKGSDTVYGALAAALAHERACYADYVAMELPVGMGGGRRGEARGRWEDATALVAQLRAVIGGEQATDR